MLESDFEDIGLLDKVKNLKIEKFVHGSDMAVVAPTWLINDKLELDDFLNDFDDDKKKSDALRDFACQPSASTRPYFKDSSILIENAEKNRFSPILDGYVLTKEFKPLPGIRYYFASDLSVSRDSCGLAMVHKQIVSADLSKFVVDFTVQLKASHAEPINYGEIRQLIYRITKRGFNLAKVGFDQFQSHDSVVILSNKGYDAEVVRYHDSLAGCGLLWDLCHHDLLIYGLCDDVFIGEASELQVVNNKRIDHLSSGGIFNSKDVWDAVVNACVLASQDKGSDFEFECLSN